MSADLILEAWVSGLIEVAKLQWMLGAGRRWTPGEPLRLLFAGYNGARNTGSDVRVEEMLRQVRHILGPENVRLSVMTQNFDLTRGYFDGVRQVKLPDIFPPFLYREIPEHDGVVACEGSMFKSKFANALTTMMIGSLAIASAENKLSVAVGAEAGDMDRVLELMCRRYVRDSLVITRNPESAERLRRLGISTEPGTDTAWTFRPLGPEYGTAVLRRAGWDDRTPLLVVCPIDPFWWPVKASLAKTVLRALSGAYEDEHYRSVYFHNGGRKVTEAYRRYLNGLASAIRRSCQEHKAFPVLVAMEALDTRTCQHLAERLGGAPIFSSLQYDMYQLVSILRCGDLMVSSRYHGIVTSMPALVPSVGVAMDERIRNLMRERGHEHLLFAVDDRDLGEKLFSAMSTLQKDAEPIRGQIGRTVSQNLRMMARMGVYFEEHVRQRYPEFRIRDGILTWQDYLPPLDRELRELVEKHSG